MKHKTKIIIDRYLKCDLSAQIFKNGKIYIFTEKTPSGVNEYPNIEFIYNNEITIDFILEELFKRKIMSVFVEAGGKLLGSFVKEGYVDKIYHFIAPKITNDNSAKSAFDGDTISLISQAKGFKLVDMKKLYPDVLLTYKPL